jgi:hypothetical protein
MPLFISYSHQDKRFVDRLAKQLVAHNVNVWLHRWELSIGDSLFEKIQAAIEGASALLVILSKASVASDWCKKDFDGGFLRELEGRKILVLPVLLDDCEITLFVRSKLYADFRKNFDDGLETILDGVAKITNPNLSREKGLTWHTDWAVDWSDISGNFFIHLTFVEQAQDQPYTVLTTIHVIWSAYAAKIYEEFSASFTREECRLRILRIVLVELEKESDIRPRLNDQFEKKLERILHGEDESETYIVEVSARRLGEDTGRDILVNSTNLVRQTVQHMERVLGRS